ncbi:sensor histidine kinase [Leucobacter luti]|uniref:sensor histidine kinase n=1 Tax=Leucobacter luti TaxID=340320 RepID=UPI003CFD1F5E
MTPPAAAAAAAAAGAGAAEWRRPRPGPESFRGDALLAAVLAVAAALTSLLYARMALFEDLAAPPVWAIGLALCTVPLAFRRRYPVPVAIIVAIGFFVCGQFTVPEVLVINICLFMALYTVGAWEPNRALALWSRIGIGVAMLTWLVVSLILAASTDDAYPGISRSGLFSAYATFAVIQIITNLLYFGGAFAFGERAWRTAKLQAQLEAQGRELELERQTSAAQAVALDRLEIARELHDVVAHHVSVMGIQAGAARRSLERDPARSSAALEVVEESAHAAVSELRRLVNTLRTPDRDDGPSTVGIAHLPELVSLSQSSGTPATLIFSGEPRPLPLLVDVALYRVVQEALTNVRKHAGRGASAEVRIRFEREAVEAEIVDDGVRETLGAVGRLGAAGGAAGVSRARDRPIPGSGLGLRGMRERVGAVAGSVHTGRRERGGFMVRARVPLSPEHDGARGGAHTSGGNA